MSEHSPLESQVFNLQTSVDRLEKDLANDGEFLNTLLTKDYEIYNPEDLGEDDNIVVLSPQLQSSVGYTSVQLLKKATRLGGKEGLPKADVEAMKERTKPLSTAVTAVAFMEALHENSIAAGGKGLLAGEYFEAELFNPVAAKKNALRMADALIAQAEHSGVTSLNIPEFVYLNVQTALVAKRAFSNVIAGKMERLRAVNLSHDDTSMRYDNAITDALLPENVGQLPKIVETVLQADQGANSLYWIPSVMVKNLMISLRYTDLEGSRQAAIEYSRFLLQPDIRDRILPSMPTAEWNAPSNTMPDPFEFSANTEVNWTILPPGKLADKAREIVGRASREKEVRIDLERLKALEEIREQWGADRSFYTTAALRGKIIRDHGQECPDEYILLVLQELDEANGVLMEHAVAESPIAGPHAMYVYRQDVGEGFSWRDVMAMPKAEAKLFNARALLHRKEGLTMSERAMALLRSDKADFLSLRFDRLKGFSFSPDVIELDESA